MAKESSVEEVTTAREKPVWFQLYAHGGLEYSRALIQRAKQSNCPVIVLTVDTLGTANRETFRKWERIAKIKQNNCLACHAEAPDSFIWRKPMFDGLDYLKWVPSESNYQLTWDHIRRLRDLMDEKQKIVIKGISPKSIERV